MEPITRQDQQKLKKKVVLKIVEEAFTTVIKKRIEKSGYLSTITDFQEDLTEDTKSMLQEADDIKEGTLWGKTTAQKTVALFITFSPKPGTIEPLIMLQEAHKIVKGKKGITTYYYSLEQSGTEADKNIGYHPHFHMLLVLDKSTQNGQRSKVRAMVERHLKPYYAGTPKYLQIKAVSQAKLQSKIDYIMGNKTDESKHPQVAADKLWRAELGLQDWYTNPLIVPPSVGLRAPTLPPKKIRDPLGADL